MAASGRSTTDDVFTAAARCRVEDRPQRRGAPRSVRSEVAAADIQCVSTNDGSIGPELRALHVAHRWNKPAHSPVYRSYAGSAEDTTMDDEERQAQDVPSQSQRDLTDHRKSGEEPWPSLIRLALACFGHCTGARRAPWFGACRWRQLIFWSRGLLRVAPEGQQRRLRPTSSSGLVDGQAWAARGRVKCLCHTDGSGDCIAMGSGTATLRQTPIRRPTQAHARKATMSFSNF
jgi:hypothetical protein